MDHGLARFTYLDRKYAATGSLPELELREYRQLDLQYHGASGLLPVRTTWDVPTQYELLVWAAGSVC